MQPIKGWVSWVCELVSSLELREEKKTDPRSCPSHASTLNVLTETLQENFKNFARYKRIQTAVNERISSLDKFSGDQYNEPCSRSSGSLT